MELEKLLVEFNEWLAEREVDGVEISSGLGASESITAVTFPIPSDEGYLPFDIIATLEEEGNAFFYVDYCDIPEVDELELYRFVNELNKASALTVTVEDDRLCFGYSLPMEILSDGAALASAFLLVWDAVDDLREEVREAFGLEAVAEESEDDSDDDLQEEEVDEEELDAEDDEPAEEAEDEE
ncbi:MAG: hypothetical protein IJF73_06455 [Clostridia bacterium]|nr:hypothetical protein [Clostridia bacterium]